MEQIPVVKLNKHHHFCVTLCAIRCVTRLYTKWQPYWTFIKIWLQLLGNEHYYWNVHAGKSFTYILAVLGTYKRLYIAIV